MNIELDPVIAAYFQAGNASDEVAFLDCFASDAVVADESQTHVGREAIRNWFRETRATYSFTSVPIQVTREESGMVVTSTVSGNFPGSPIDLSYRFQLSNGLISKLTII